MWYLVAYDGLYDRGLEIVSTLLFGDRVLASGSHAAMREALRLFTEGQ